MIQPQQAVPLLPRQPFLEEDSILDPSIIGDQQFFSVEDVGMDDFEVAEERVNLFGEQVNPDIMTYEQLLALQERIGFVTRGMTVQEMNQYP